MPTPQDRIATALQIAPAGAYDGAHHKTWVIDQIVRALTGCTTINQYELEDDSDEYTQFISENPGWDTGIAP